MNNHPVLLLVMIAGSLYMLHLWKQDLLAHVNGQPNPGALPGATPCSTKAVVIAIAGALILLGIETGGEIALGIDEEQSTITALFGVYTLIAAFVEELIFRGYLVVDNRGKGIQWLGIVGASALFALLHPFLWNWEDGSLTWTTSWKAWFSTTIVFFSSLWFYAVRFMAVNTNKSLLPCIAAHVSKNIGVVIIKSVQGFLTAWW